LKTRRPGEEDRVEGPAGAEPGRRSPARYGPLPEQLCGMALTLATSGSAMALSRKPGDRPSSPSQWRERYPLGSRAPSCRPSCGRPRPGRGELRRLLAQTRESLVRRAEQLGDGVGMRHREPGCRTAPRRSVESAGGRSRRPARSGRRRVLQAATTPRRRPRRDVVPAPLGLPRRREAAVGEVQEVADDDVPRSLARAVDHPGRRRRPAPLGDGLAGDAVSEVFGPLVVVDPRPVSDSVDRPILDNPRRLRGHLRRYT